jgi:NAD(P)-dependent dehydrogenase (short-subunit alcohol dehydrogenase family)
MNPPVCADGKVFGIMEGANGRVAVVTGAARGIGQAIALRLAEAGHALALGDVRPLDETVATIAGAWPGGCHRIEGYSTRLVREESLTCDFSMRRLPATT